MKKQISIAILGILVLALSACSAPAAASDPGMGNINVTGNGRVTLVPDTAYIHIGVHSEAEEVTEALDANSQQAQAIVNVLTEMGVAAEDIQTTAFNVYPMQEYGPMGELTRTQYGVDNTVLVTVRDLSNLGSMLDAVVQAGANTINSISFDSQDKEAAYSEARRLAVQNARQQAEELAAAAGVEVGEVTSMNAYSNGPMPLIEAKTYAGQGGSPVPVAAGQLVISVDANVSFAIK